MENRGKTYFFYTRVLPTGSKRKYVHVLHVRKKTNEIQKYVKRRSRDDKTDLHAV